MGESSTQALAWRWDNDPELAAMEATPLGAARLIVETAVPVRWGKADQAGIERASAAIVADPHYRSDVWRDARYRVDAERGSYALMGDRLVAAKARLDRGGGA